MLHWQSPTDWSRETTDGVYYLEQTHDKSAWLCFHLGKRIGQTDTEEASKALCEVHVVQAEANRRSA